MPQSPRPFGLVPAALLGLAGAGPATTRPVPPPQLPAAGRVTVDADRGEVVVHAVTRHPAGKPCIDAYGARVQAFVGCDRAAGRAATMADYFVFAVDVPTEDVAAAITSLGVRPRVAYAMVEGHRRAEAPGPKTSADYLQGDPVTLSIGWQDAAGTWVERPYADFCTERVRQSDGRTVERPWRPRFVYHGSGATFASGTGCVACPCDCAGGLIADARFPLYDLTSTSVRFDTTKAPPPGTEVYVRIRPVARPGPASRPAGELLGNVPTKQ